MNETTTPEQGVVVITGASRGLGLGLACLLAAQHVPMVITSRSKGPLHRVVEQLKTSAPVIGLQADAADEVSMQRVADAAATLGTLQGWVNNAGVLEPIGAVQDIDVAQFDLLLRTNVIGVLVGMRLALRHRAAESVLRIVNVSSGAAVHAYAGWAAYCCSKAAVNSLTSVAAAEQAQAGNTSVVCVAPGIIETAMQRTIRATSPERFPDQAKFVDLKNRGALANAVDAAVLLDWLVRAAPLDLSGRFVDCFDKQVQIAVRQRSESMPQALQQAVRWAQVLEPTG